MRIVSLLPSATDILSALGADAEIVGVSHSCGGRWQHLPRLTSTWIDTQSTSAEIDAQVESATRPLYELDVETLAALAPDVVVSQSLCEVCAIPAGDVETALHEIPSAPVLIDLSPTRLHDIPADIATVAGAIDRPTQGQTLKNRWRDTFEPLRAKYQREAWRVAFLDWLDPPFAAGHWIPDMIEWLGGRSVLARPGQPSHQTSWSVIEHSAPDMVIAACCGFDQTRATMDPVGTALPVIRLDGYQHFSRPSPVLMDSIGVLDQVFAEASHA